MRERNDFENHFEVKENWDQLWTTETNNYRLTEKMIPRLLALPSFIADYLQAQGGTCLPYHLHTYIQDHLNEDTTIDAERCELILDWCIAAVQEKMTQSF